MIKPLPYYAITGFLLRARQKLSSIRDIALKTITIPRYLSSLMHSVYIAIQSSLGFINSIVPFVKDLFFTSEYTISLQENNSNNAENILRISTLNYSNFWKFLPYSGNKKFGFCVKWVINNDLTGWHYSGALIK